MERLAALPALVDVSSPGLSFERRNKSSSALDLRPQVTKLEPLEKLKKADSVIDTVKPTALDEKIKNILESINKIDDSKKPEFTREYCKEIRAFPHHSKEKVEAEDFSKKNKSEDDYAKAIDQHQNKFEVDNDLETEEKKPDFMTVEKPREESPGSGVETPSQEVSRKNQKATELSIAKRYHEENLRHKPLPDVIDDPVYKALLNGKHSSSRELSNVEGMPSAIGWKNYSVPGPTECSKLKVFRPKTALEKVQQARENGRPKTCDSKGKSKRKWLPIDLAICWDLKPEDPSEEPKRSPHIDGSNGSVAPAVFTMIHPHEAEEEPEADYGSCQAVTEKITKSIADDNLANLPSQTNGKTPSPLARNINKEAIMTCIKSSPKLKNSQSQSSASINSISTNAADFARKNPKTAWSNEDTSKVLSSKLYHLQKVNSKQDDTNNQWNSFRNLNHKKNHQSTPNLMSTSENSTTSPCSGLAKTSTSPLKTNNSSKNEEYPSIDPISKGDKSKIPKTNQKGRNCSACEKSNSDETRDRQEFKAAFKAGVPKSESSNSGSTTAAKSYKVPKMKLPYAKKSYSIGTLVPPFSFWPESNGQEYPEHWRLASVYQHSYKPINARKRPMLASVYQ